MDRTTMGTSKRKERIVQLLIRIFTQRDMGNNLPILDFQATGVHKEFLLDCLENIKKYIEQLEDKSDVRSE